MNGGRARGIAVLIILSLALTACGNDGSEPANAWSQGLQDGFTSVCVEVSRSLGVGDPESVCSCILRELQEELSEQAYLDLPQPERDLAGGGMGVICSTR